jgi:hypothetical protein
MEVLSFVSPKWVYILKSVEKWLCKIFFYQLLFQNSKFQMI